MRERTALWVIGASGLLGSAVTRVARSDARWAPIEAQALPWAAATAVFTEAVARNVDALIGEARRHGGEWSIVWAAGAGVVASDPSVFDAERQRLLLALDVIASRTSGTSGAFVYASSAGGIYAGSPTPPFTEAAEAVPISPYGHAKLASERIVAAWAAEHGIPAFIGRIANLYGPGQRLDKMQGLISHLVLAQLSPTPASIFVSLDTRRDYIYVDDCAALLLDGAARLSTDVVGGETVVKNLASGQPVTIADLIGLVTAISKRRANVMLGFSATAKYQARDLRITSVVWPELDRRERTPLPAGINMVAEDLRLRMQTPARTDTA